MRERIKITRLCGFLAMMFFALATGASAQELEFPKSPTLWVDCGTGEQKPKASIISGPVFVAKSGQHRAKVEVELKGNGDDCLHTTTLLVSNGTELNYTAAYVQFPVKPDWWGTGMRLIDWSQDARLLLAELWLWNSAADEGGIDKRVEVFALNPNKQYEIKLRDLLTDSKANCLIQFQLLGFTPDSWIALKTKISTFYSIDDTIDDKPPDKRCERRVEVWKINPQTQQRLPLPKNFQPERYSIQMKGEVATE